MTPLMIYRFYPTYRPTLKQKLNPCWWFGNDREPKADYWYMPNKPQWQRQAFWYLRNFMFNFKLYVVGIADRVYDRYSNQNAQSVFTWSAKGWIFAYARIVSEKGKYGWMRFPYASYASKSFQFYIGWCPDGRLDMTIRKEWHRG